MKCKLLSIDKTNVIGVSMDIDEIMQINDADYSITVSMYLNIEWQEPRLVMLPSFGASLRPGNSKEHVMVPMNLEFVKDLWLPNIFIYNLKTFKVIDVLLKLAGLWIDTDKRVLYSQAPPITFICPIHPLLQGKYTGLETACLVSR